MDDEARIFDFDLPKSGSELFSRAASKSWTLKEREEELDPNLSEAGIKDRIEFLASPNSVHYEKPLHELLAAKENPQAQIAAFTYIIGLTSSYDLMKELIKIDFPLLQSKFNINPHHYQEIANKIKSLYGQSKELNEEREGHQTSYSGNIEQEFLKALIEKENENQFEIDLVLLEFRKRMLEDASVSDGFKKRIIIQFHSAENISKFHPTLKNIVSSYNQKVDEILKFCYEDPDTSKDIKNVIATNIITRVNDDTFALQLIPISDYPELGIDLDRVFIAAFSSEVISGDDIESIVSPMFLPEEDPKKVRAVWECLRQESWSPNKDKKTSVAFYPGSEIRRSYFKDFLQNVDELLPLVNTLAPYGFTYGPKRIMDGQFIYDPDYIPNLLELAKNLLSLESDIRKIKNVYPEFKYNIEKNTDYYPVDKVTKNTFVDNPYVLAFKQFYDHNYDKLEKIVIFDEGIKILNLIPQESLKLRESFAKEIIQWSSRWIMWNLEEEQEGVNRVVKILNGIIINPVISEDTLEIVATRFFYNSLKPECRNAEFAFWFLEKNLNKIAPSNPQEGLSEEDNLWFEYVKKVGDIYRYNLSGGNIEDKKEMAKKDLSLALKAAEKISDHITKDLALEELVYAYTDADYVDLEIAQNLAKWILDPKIKLNAEEEIKMERERQEKGLTTVWKKIEKVRRHAKENIQLLVDLIGFSKKEAKELYLSKTNEYVRSATMKGSIEERSESLAGEVERIKPDIGVTVNMSWETLLNMLEEGKMLSIWEHQELMRKRNKTMNYHYGERRDEVERQLGNRAKGGASDPHPIYGAICSPNKRDEYFGAALRYGECFIKLRNERIKDRMTCVFDDSFDGFTDFPFLWEEAATAAALMNLINYKTLHGYTEAQILGGVTLDDIESISIPKLVLQQVQKQYGIEGVERVLDQINKIRELFPNIEVRIIEEASASKVLEILSSYFQLPEVYMDSMRKYYKEIDKYG